MSGTLLRHEWGTLFIVKDSKEKEMFNSVERVKLSEYTRGCEMCFIYHL